MQGLSFATASGGASITPSTSTFVDLPGTVEKVILARIDRLSPDCHRVLTAASVLGRRFGLPLLEGVAGGNGELRDQLRELQRVDLVRESRRWPQPEYRFKHAMIQEAAY